MFFERDMYQHLVRWVNDFSDYALYLRGPRQVGKTSILEKLAEEHFERYVYINLRDEDEFERFEKIYRKHRDIHGHGKVDDKHGPLWVDVLCEFAPHYTNDRGTLVVLDEIQESSLFYNFIRQIRRSLKSCLAVTGSYLGFCCQ